MRESTPQGRSQKTAIAKPKKPYPGFPLGPSSNGYWQKRIKGEVHRFGRWGKIVNGKMERLPGDGWQAALAVYTAQRDDLYAGRRPRTKLDGVTVGHLRDKFLTSKSRQLDAKELSGRMYAEYKATATRVVDFFGENRLVDDLDSDDFASLRVQFAEKSGPHRIGNEVQRTRTLFKWGYESGLLDKPMRFGPGFQKPSKAVMRRHRAKSPPKLFEPGELRRIVDAASVPLRAMVLLGINAGFGNGDCSTLPLSVVDLKSGWIAYPRPKTGIDRRCPLWPETAAAVQAAIDARPKPTEAAAVQCLFVTKFGDNYIRELADGSHYDALAQEFKKLLAKLKIDGRTFYALRHTFRTVADAARDIPAVRFIMGHADNSIDDVYRERIEDERLQAVANHVHGWLFAAEKGGDE
jgi:integrase